MRGRSPRLRGRSGAVRRTPVAMRCRISGFMVSRTSLWAALFRGDARHGRPAHKRPSRSAERPRASVRVGASHDQTPARPAARPSQVLAPPGRRMRRWSVGTCSSCQQAAGKASLAAVRLVTWNIAGRVRAQPEQAAVLAAINADVVALQEVTSRTAPLWRASFSTVGLLTVDALDGLPAGKSRRRLAVMTAARGELERLELPEMPWPERVLRCRVDGLEVINVHSPIAPSPELAKIRTHEAVATFLTRPSDRPRVLCGDLNTPRRELADGTLLTFAHDSKG